MSPNQKLTQSDRESVVQKARETRFFILISPTDRQCSYTRRSGVVGNGPPTLAGRLSPPTDHASAAQITPVQ